MGNSSDFERLGYFYLGKRVEAGKVTDDMVLVRGNDLSTHAVIVGMTGSGKTGLGVALIEEALIDGIPVIAIDPKGDLGNLLLTFPDFRADDFRPWVSAAEAAAKGLSVDDYAQQQATQWREGLAEWGQTPDRVTRLIDAADRRIYTPGSTAGTALSMLSSFKAPGPGVAADSELLGDRIEAAVSGLLTLIGIEPDPVASREHVLLANIFRHHWMHGNDVSLETLVAGIQNPPFEQVGLLALEAFFPRSDRFQFTVRLNQLVAAPGFETWLRGEPLDAQRLLFTRDGRPRLSVVSISHLSDAERMFAVTSLLNEIISWMRSQPGTSALRAVLYMDEVFGFLPPVANPPSKKLFLTLLKQARAYGLSTILSTQNPVDLDYKAVSNAGTWFIGRLQTERDKARLLDGMSTVGQATDLAALSDTISGLDKRQFVLHSVHERERMVFTTRWVMSYLAGPMTRDQIRQLTAASEAGEIHAPTAASEGDRSPVRTAASDGDQINGRPPVSDGDQIRTPAASHDDGVGSSTSASEDDRIGSSASASRASSSSAPAAPPAHGGARRGASGSKPVLPPSITEVFLADPPTGASAATYEPVLFGRVRVMISDAKAGVREERLLHFEIDEPANHNDPGWNRAAMAEANAVQLATSPPTGSTFIVPPAALQSPDRFKTWSAALKDYVERTQTVELLTSPSAGLTSEPGESEAAFRIRVRQLGRERRDKELDAVRPKFEKRVRTLEDRLQRATHAIEREAQQAGQAKLNTTIAVGQTLLGALFGRRGSSFSRAGTAARSASRIAKEAADVERAQEKADRVEEELRELREDMEMALEEIRDRYEEDEAFATTVIRPRPSDVDVLQIGVLWRPAR